MCVPLAPRAFKRKISQLDSFQQEQVLIQTEAEELPFQQEVQTVWEPALTVSPLGTIVVPSDESDRSTPNDRSAPLKEESSACVGGSDVNDDLLFDFVR